MNFHYLGFDIITVHNTASAETLFIRVENLVIKTVFRNTDAVFVTPDGLKITYRNNFITVFVGALECNNAVCVIIMVNPVKAFPDRVKLVERLAVKIKFVELLKKCYELFFLL